jgi:phosphoribosylpyrophosphate synthetase
MMFYNEGLAMIIKYRKEAQKVDEMYLVGNVNNKNIIIIDDIIDTGVYFFHIQNINNANQ